MNLSLKRCPKPRHWQIGDVLGFDVLNDCAVGTRNNEGDTIATRKKGVEIARWDQ